MIIYIESEHKDAAFHFSLEAYIMQHYPWNKPVMMIWQTEKCAMLGSNQVADAEININYAKQKGIQIVRRSSGGGTIYTDLGTLLYTVIRPYTKGQSPLEIAKEKVATPIVEALNQIGIPAHIKGRNDILVNGKKVSGFAQYVRHGRICTHGSLLYDTDLDTLAHVLQVDEEKIRSKALRSVRSRVTNLKEYLNQPCTTHAFRELLKQHLFDQKPIQTYTLTEHDHAQINQIYQQQYGNPTWTFVQSPKFSFQNSKRFQDGKVEVYLDVVKGSVVSCSIRGDFLGVASISALEKLFEGKLFQYQSFEEVLNEVSLELYLGNISKDELLSCIFD
ncbi:MAG: lipoate--protein ligase [Lachnospiraceae bacterium]|nr:lipoate--protein ligase [Lachnospiraceae bacterium]